MEVTRKNFKDALPLVKKSIEAADFLAIDGEFTGLMSGRDVSAFDSPAEYYKRLLEGASDFLLIQYGLVAFCWDPETNSYKNDAYTFYVFPRTRPGPDKVFMCQSSSLEFLISHGFDFNKLFSEGIPYLTEPTETSLRDKLQERQKSYTNNRETPITVPAENKAQIDEICARVEKFLSTSEPESLEIDRCNAFIRKLVFQEVGHKFKDTAYIETKVLENKDRVLKITRITSPEDVGGREEERKQREWDELEDAVGFARVMRMVTESEKLVIGHNMLLDVMHTLNHFYQPLPEDYASFKEFTHCMFPRLLDTKYMSSLPPFKDKVNSSMLSHLLATLSEEPFSMPNSDSAEGRGYALADSKSHEAGYDAYITGLCFLSMHGHLACMRGDKTPASQRVLHDAPSLKPFLNKLYLFKTAHQDSPYINLAGKDPEPSREHVFHLTFPREWSRNDIVQLFSPFGPVFVQFTDDTSALVALSRREQARAAARVLASSTTRGATVHTYAHYKNIYAKTVGAKQSLWLSKERLDEYKKRAQVISAAKPVASEPVLPAPDDTVSSAPTEEGFISLKTPLPTRKRTSSASSGDKNPAGRKRTSSGVFVIDVHSPVDPQPKKLLEAKQNRSQTRKERRGKKHQVYEEMVFAKKQKIEPQSKQKKDIETQKMEFETQKMEFETQKIEFESEKELAEERANTKRVSAFEESDNWE